MNIIDADLIQQQSVAVKGLDYSKPLYNPELSELITVFNPIVCKVRNIDPEIMKKFKIFIEREGYRYLRLYREFKRRNNSNLGQIMTSLCPVYAIIMNEACY